MKRTVFIISLFALAFILSACSSQPKTLSFGERIKAESSDTVKIGNSWINGDKLVIDGNKLAKKGQKDIERAKTLVAKAEKKLKKAKI